MNQRILLVDDEENALQGYVRTLRRRFEVATANSGSAALAFLEAEGPHAVIVADMRMPHMDGVQLLSTVKERYPDMVRIMLTGNADQQTAQSAVNQGAIFRFLSKPCDGETLMATLTAALEQHRLVTAERELLEKTLRGAVQMLVELLSMLAPDTLNNANRLAHLAERVGQALGMDNRWQLGVAAVLAQVGILTMPGPLVAKMKSGGRLDPLEKETLHKIPEIGAHLVRNIPRLEPVAELILYSQKNVDGSGFPHDDKAGEAIPLGARILKVLADYLLLPQGAMGLAEMRARKDVYDPQVLQALQGVLGETQATQGTLKVPVNGLKVGHTLVEAVETKDGWLVAPAGTVLGVSHIERLRNFHRVNGLKEPIHVMEG